MSTDSRPPSTDGGDGQTCLYCGSTNLRTDSKTKNVQQHSHRGTRIDVSTCRDCGGQILHRTQVTARSTSSWSAPSTAEWRIPDGYCLIVCPECGSIVDGRDLTDDEDRAFVEHVQEAERETVCDVPAEVVTDHYEVGPGGKPVEAIPEREVPGE